MLRSLIFLLLANTLVAALLAGPLPAARCHIRERAGQCKCCPPAMIDNESGVLVLV